MRVGMVSVGGMPLNFRDLGAVCPGMRRGRLFRTSCPREARQVSKLAALSLVDLRSPAEQAADPAGLFSGAGFRCMSHPMAEPALWAGRADGGGAVDGAGRDLHLVPFLDERSLYRSLFWRLRKRDRVRLLWHSAFDKPKARRLGIRRMNEGGLPQLYEILLDASAHQIGKAMQLLTLALEAGEGSGAAAFFCKWGKDRTGVLAMMVLLTLGAPREAVVEDYVLSDATAHFALGDVRIEGLDLDVFSRAPPEAAVHLMDYLDAKFGGAERFLASRRCGFTREWQDRLRRQMALPAATMPTSPEPMTAETT